MNGSIKWLAAGLALGCAVLVAAGCATQSTARRASVVDFLYPKKAAPVDVPGPTVMALPLRVGIVFVPETGTSDAERQQGQWARPTLSVFTEKDKIALMEKIGKGFKKYPFVKSVEYIPSQYLTPGGSFDNLDQIRTMFGTDVMVLLSYDQVQFTDESWQTLSYWTVVGAYAVHGERNETHTMIDAVAYYLPNRKLLFRAPGISRVKAGATPVDLSRELRADSERGFALAADNAITNLTAQLAVFKDRIKEEPEDFKVVAKPGYDLKAVGGLQPVTALLVVAFVGGLCLCAQPQNSH
jgi:rhombotail lipoprotein